MARNLGQVIDQMLEHVPAEHPLRERFEWLAGHIRYKAPEQMLEGWHEAAAILGAELGPPNGPHIIMGRRRERNGLAPEGRE